MSAWRHGVGVAAMLVAVTVVLTWPLAPRLDSAVIDFGDPLLNSWILAWDLHALGHAPLKLFDANIFHPRRWTLAYSEHLLGLLPLAAPLALAGSPPILVHNAVLFATFPLVGLTMFLLVRYLTGCASAGVVAGLLYAFSHYRFGHLGHVQLLSHQWLPLMLLGLHRVVEGGGRWRDIALAAAAFGLQALSSGYYAYFAAIALAVFVVWVAGPVTRPPLGRAARRGLLAGAGVALLMAPLFLPYYVVRQEFGLKRGVGETQEYAAHPTSYLAAPRENRWFGTLTAGFRRSEGALFPGVVTLALAITGLATGCLRSGAGPGGLGPAGVPRLDGAADLREAPVLRATADRAGAHTGGLHSRWPRWIDLVLAGFLLVTLANAFVVGGFAVTLGPIRVSQRHFEGAAVLITVALILRRVTHGRAVALGGFGWLRRLGWPNVAGYYVGVTAVAILCSFGPTLTLNDRPVARPIYQQLYKRVPGFDGLRVPARFAVLASTGLAVLAGFGAAAIVRATKGRAGRVAVATVLGGLAIVEAWSIPLPFRDVRLEAGPAERWLAGPGPPGPVAALPIYEDAERETRRLLLSVVHWQPLVNGYSGFFPPGYQQTVETLRTFPDPMAIAHLRELGVRHAVLYLSEFPEDARRRVESALRTLPPGLVQVAAFENTVIVEVRPAR